MLSCKSFLKQDFDCCKFWDLSSKSCALQERIQRHHEKCHGEHDGQNNQNGALFACSFDVCVYSSDASIGWNQSYSAEEDGESEVKLAKEPELEGDDDAGDHCDVLISSTHYLRHHVVRQKQRS